MSYHTSKTMASEIVMESNGFSLSFFLFLLCHPPLGFGHSSHYLVQTYEMFKDSFSHMLRISRGNVTGTSSELYIMIPTRFNKQLMCGQSMSKISNRHLLKLNNRKHHIQIFRFIPCRTDERREESSPPAHMLPSLTHAEDRRKE